MHFDFISQFFIIYIQKKRIERERAIANKYKNQLACQQIYRYLVDIRKL